MNSKEHISGESEVLTTAFAFALKVALPGNPKMHPDDTTVASTADTQEIY